MKLIPYLNFQGNAWEAMSFYQKVFNGTLHDVSHFGDTNPNMPEDQKNGIMHGRLAFGDNLIMFSDSMHGHVVYFGNSVNLSIGLNDEAEAYSVFNQLADSGQITVPMAKQFWGAIFGMVTDKFGIHWMINCEVGS
jgi:PhnB protein